MASLKQCIVPNVLSIEITVMIAIKWVKYFNYFSRIVEISCPSMFETALLHIWPETISRFSHNAFLQFHFSVY